MIISHKHKFIFVKTRKTAGSTLEHLLYPHLGKQDICSGSTRDNTPALNMGIDTNGHVGWRTIAAKYPTEWRDYYKFTIERNPWDKVVSSFFWHKKIKPYLNEVKDNDFTKYCRESSLLPTDWFLYSNGKNLAKDGKVCVDRVFKYEDMPAMYKFFEDRFGISVPEEDYTQTRMKSGVRPAVQYTDLHTEESIEIVRRKFVNEISYMEYHYGND